MKTAFRSKPAAICFVALCSFYLGCTALSHQARMEAYERTMFDYDTALQLSDFNRVCGFLDPEVMTREACRKRYENLKIIEYELLSATVSQDKRQATQSILVDYHFRDRVVVKKIRYEQSWQYREETKSWRLQSEPPVFQ